MHPAHLSSALLHGSILAKHRTTPASTLIMLGLGGLLVAMSVTWLPRVVASYNLEEIQCQVNSFQIDTTSDPRESVVNVRVSWTIGSSSYRTARLQRWRTFNPQHVTRQRLEENYTPGRRLPCFIDHAEPDRVYARKADFQELGWLIGVCLVGLLLVGMGLRRTWGIWRNRDADPPSDVFKSTLLDYRSTPTEPTAPPPAPRDLSAWREALEATALERVDPHRFAYTGTFGTLRIDAFQDEDTGGLTLRFSRDDEVPVPAAFWLKRREGDDPIAAHRNFWVSFDLDLDAHVEVTGYDAIQVASFLDAEARALVRALVVNHEMRLYGGKQEVQEVDRLKIEIGEGEFGVLNHLILWFEHVLDPRGARTERLAGMALKDPIPLVRLHRLFALIQQASGETITRETLEAATADPDPGIDAVAKFLQEPQADPTPVGEPMLKHMESIFAHHGIALELAQRVLTLFWDTVPRRIQTASMPLAILSDYEALAQLVFGWVEKEDRLSEPLEDAAIALVDRPYSPIRIPAIQLLGRLGTARGRDALLPYTDERYQHSQLGESASAALENIAGREGRAPEPEGA